MKKAFLLLLSLLLTLSGWGLKAEEPEYICTAMHQEFLENGVVTSTYDYCSPVDDQGLVTGVEEYKDGVLTLRSTFTYDEYGNTLQVVEEKDGIRKVADYKNTLDRQGRILRQEVWVDGTMTSFEEHSYDKKGNETRFHSSLWNSVTEQTDWRTYTMRYDWRGNLIQKELHWNFNEEYTIWEYEDGHRIRQTSYLEETGQVTEKLENTFDEQGNQTRKVYRNPVTDKETEFWEYTYDEQGRCIRESRYSKTGTLEHYRETVYDDEARTKTSTYFNADGTQDTASSPVMITYDAHGNEISKEYYHDGEVYWRITYVWELPEAEN